MRCEIHKYRRFRATTATAGSKFIFRCIRPGCTHWVTKNFVLGRKAECWICSDTFVMSHLSLQSKPNCGCRRRALKMIASLDKDMLPQRRALDKLMDKI